MGHGDVLRHHRALVERRDTGGAGLRLQRGALVSLHSGSRVTVWYSAPTAIRLLMREGAELARRFDLASLRHLASVGEPLNPEAVIWSRDHVREPFHDTFWQTETGCIVITNPPGMPISPGRWPAVPRHHGCAAGSKTTRSITDTGRVGSHRAASRLASMMRRVLEQPGGVRREVPGTAGTIAANRATVRQPTAHWSSGATTT